MGNLFFELALIDFESGNIHYDDLESISRKLGIKDDLWEMRKIFYKSSFIYKIWLFLYQITPNHRNLDYILSKLVGGHINFCGVTFFGYNAMMWAIQWRGTFQDKHGVFFYFVPHVF
jgi:hypothetical protein